MLLCWVLILAILSAPRPWVGEVKEQKDIQKTADRRKVDSSGVVLCQVSRHSRHARVVTASRLLTNADGILRKQRTQAIASLPDKEIRVLLTTHRVESGEVLPHPKESQNQSAKKNRTATLSEYPVSGARK